MIKLLIFDLDDTLYYEKEYVLCAFRNVCRFLADRYKKSEDDLYKSCIDILDKYGRGKIFDMLCANNNIKHNIKELVNIYRGSEPSLKLYKDSQEILTWAKVNNIKTGIITDGCSVVQWNKIRALSLNDKIDKIIVTDDYGEGYSKPNTRSYKEMLDFFKVDAKDSIYIGDNPDKDFIGAKSIGMKTIRIIRKNGDHIDKNADFYHKADDIIYDLNEISNLR